MLKILVGPKGSGKTKRLIESVNTAAQNSNGAVVCVEMGMMLTYDLSYSVKLVNIAEYHIEGYDQLAGFLGGLLAGNYDTTDVYVDGLFKICGRDYSRLEEFFDKVAKLAEPHNVRFIFTVSAELSELPEGIQKYL